MQCGQHNVPLQTLTLADGTTAADACPRCVFGDTALADENATLTAENARLREALDRLTRQAMLTDDYDETPHSTLRSAVLQARAALTPASAGKEQADGLPT